LISLGKIGFVWRSCMSIIRQPKFQSYVLSALSEYYTE
jgi:hypothetical protein